MDTPGPTPQQRAEGCLLGLALGDALGAPFEGRRNVDADALDAVLADDAPLRWTDDTHMALALARSLVACGGEVDQQHLGDAFAAAYAAEPWRGYGPGPPQVFAAAQRGSTYVDAAAALFGGSGSFGNGGAMRCAPVALVASTPAHAARLAADQARVTHAHPQGVDGAVLLAVVVHRARHAPADRPLRAADVLPAGDLLGSRALVDALQALADCAHDRDALLALARRFGSSVVARESVPAAIAVALAAGRDVLATVREAVLLGGDTDTVAAMAGAVTGAHRGTASLPDDLRARLEAADELADAARTLQQDR